MELSKKTSILFSPAQHEQLSRLAAEKHMSLGEIVRSACETQYGRSSEGSRLDAVRQLSALALPVADTRTMKEQSIPGPDEICP